MKYRTKFPAICEAYLERSNIKAFPGYTVSQWETLFQSKSDKRGSILAQTSSTEVECLAKKH